MDLGSSSTTPPMVGDSEIEEKHFQVNDSMYILHKPEGMPSMQVLLFHGLQLVEDYSNAHLSTWKSHDGSCTWPKKWLAEEFPGAEIISMSYRIWLGKNANKTADMYNLSENLISDLLQGGIGQTLHCPVILVGHSIGGLIIKQLCSEAHDRLHKTQGIEKDRLAAFLKNIRGIFFYATLHHGSFVTKELVDIIGDPLLKYVKTLSVDTARLNQRFEATKKVYGWWEAGLGETRCTKLGSSLSVFVAPEASARCENFNTVEDANHISICRPSNKMSRSFLKLKGFLADIAKNMKEEAKRFEETRAKEEAKASHQCQGLPDYPVELVARTHDVLEKLRGGAVLGIFGMGGVGKTTLAKQVFNTSSRDFEYTCFVDNVKGIDLHQLEDWLLSHLHQSGMKLDRTQWSNVKDSKILIVMDDIDSEDQLKFLPKFQHFGKGSCLMMTSRDKEVFKFYENCAVYEVDFLKQEGSMKLFCQNAFRSQEIPKLLQESVEKVVEKCGGLPLTLEVMGRYLRDHTTDTEVWEQTIEKLGKAQSITGDRNDRVWVSLRVSYDTLSKEEQEMFIEAATIFWEEPLEEALAAWSSITGYAETTWRNLVNRSLVREVDKHYYSVWDLDHFECKVVWVHEQLRDLAGDIVKGGGLPVVNKGSNLLVEQINRNAVEFQPSCLRLGHDSAEDQKILQLDKLAKMKRLKYLDLYHVFGEGRGKGLSSELAILKWRGCDRPGHHPRLRWLPCFTPLKVPTFKINLNEMKKLAILKLRNFVVPKEFHEALGNLINLRFLWLEDLEGLDRLPENFGNLSRLKRLTLTNLRYMKLPESFGNLKALEQLAIQEIEELDRLPENFGNLSLLKRLTLNNLRYMKLPELFGNLKALEQLAIQNMEGLDRLPENFGNLATLEDLQIVDCPLIKFLPRSFSRLSKLRRLEISGYGPELDDAFGNTRSTLDTLPENFHLLESLRELRLDCPKLERLPERLGELALLEVLDLSVDSVNALPESVGNLSLLRELKFKSRNAELLPENLGLLSSLKALRLDCDSLEKLPNSLLELSSMEELSIRAKMLLWLPERTGRLQSLRRLSLAVRSVTSLAEIIRQSLVLRELIFHCDGHEETSNLFENLSSFSQKLVLWGWYSAKLPAGLGSLSSLTELEISWFDLLQRLPDELGELRSLERLQISFCRNLKSLPESLGRISSLRHVSLHYCDKLKSLPDSLRRASSPELALLQGDNSNNGKRQEEESSQTKVTEGIELCIAGCRFLDKSVLESLGWTCVSSKYGQRYYRVRRADAG